MYLDTTFDRSSDSNVHDGPTIRQTLLRLFDELGPAKACFGGGIRFVSAELDETVGHPDGPCTMFYGLFARLERRRTHALRLATAGNELAALRERARRKRMSGSAAAAAAAAGDDEG